MYPIRSKLLLCERASKNLTQRRKDAKDGDEFRSRLLIFKLERDGARDAL